MGQHAPQALLLCLRDPCPEGGVTLHIQVVHPGLGRKARRGIRVAVSVRDIGLDVVDGGAVHEVGAPHDVAEIFQPAHGVRVAVLRGKNDLAPQAVHQPALARDAKLGGERRVDVGDDIQGHRFCGSFFHDNLLLP